ncbi:hypothetical protein GOP47_0000501 [Adiantum capillus-veneris]|uniref:Bromo domain-containing protein n=1 Tax=Adiantum capillus-veneris TaxID=13818 RepID=A0A9D4VDN0_ADICA|nr:hypothetical protein GOP47_0000501 [Adiantum capillus-veneris]
MDNTLCQQVVKLELFLQSCEAFQMALECRKMSNAGLVVSNLVKVLPYDGNDQQAPVVSMMNNGKDQELSVGLSRRKAQADVDIREVYFLIMHFLSEGPCRRSSAQLKVELEQLGLLPRRYHAWYSRSGMCSGELDDDGISVPLSYSQLLERFSFIEKNHLVRLLEELFNRNTAWRFNFDAKNPTAADASTLLGNGSVSLLNNGSGTPQLNCLRNRAGQVYGLTLRELGGGLARHQRAPAIRAASYEILQPSVLVNRIQKIKTFRGHRNAVYCAIFDKSGEYIITGSDDRLVKVWSTATGFCLCSCRGHEGDITDLAVSANNLLLASASNDCFIRVWRFPDGCPLSVLKGHVSAVTAIAFSPRQGCEYLLLSASDDGTCRIWDARDSSRNPRIYAPKPEGPEAGTKINDLGQPSVQPKTQIICCAFNASGTVFVTGSSDRLARVWDACKWSDEVHGGPYNEFDTLKGHEDDVNYVQFSGCASPSRPINVDSRPLNVGALAKSERLSRFRNSWFGYENIVTCSRDGSAIIWVPRPRKYHGKSKWMKGYHLRVPPPPMPPQPPRGVPRQRLLPTPRGVNMIVWSLDNRYVLAAIMDCRICVWNAVDGGLVHSLTGHTKSTFVLDVHPYDPRIAMSAGYDGRVIIWDIWEGCSIHEYKIGDFHLVDGKFSPDGTSIVISDEVGQIYLLATGEGRSQKDAKYDQFFLGDYRPLARDVYGNVLDQETQITPHARNMRDLLCDANMIPYLEPYQSTYQQRRLGALGISWNPPPAQWVAGLSDDSSYLTVGFPLLPPPHEDEDDAHQEGIRWVEQPFDEEAMEWEQDSVDDAGSDYTLSFENACEEDERDYSLTSSEDFPESLDEEESSEEDELSQKARLRRSERNKKREEEAGTSGGRGSKRKHRDRSRDHSLRRSKRHKRSKRVSPSNRGSDGEQSTRRPKRLAARNARRFFSRIGAEENAYDDSEFFEEVESEGNEQSSRQSPEKEDDEKQDFKQADGGSAVEAEPSEIEWSRPTRSNPSGRLRGSIRKTPKAQASSQLPGAAASSSEEGSEEHAHASVDLVCNASMNSTRQLEMACVGQVSSTATTNQEQNLRVTHETSDQDLDAVSTQRGKRKRENYSPSAHKSPRVEAVNEPLRRDENVRKEGDYDSMSNGPGEGYHSSDVFVQPEHVIKMKGKSRSHIVMTGEASSHSIQNDDGFCSLSEHADSEQKSKLLDGCKRTAQEKETINDMLEITVSQDNNIESLEELIGEAQLSNENCPTSSYLNSCMVDASVTSSALHQVIKTEHLGANLPSPNSDFGLDHSVAPAALAVEGEEVDYCFEKATEFEEEAPLNPTNGFSNFQGKPIKVVIGTSKKHQTTVSSWQRDSPACLWLRQQEDEAHASEESLAEPSSSLSAGENRVKGYGQHCESAGQARHLKLTFRRGKRKAMKPRRKTDFRPESPAAVDVCETAVADHEVKDILEPTPDKLENGPDEDELLGRMKVTLTYVRTRRHGNGDKSGKLVHDKEAGTDNDTGSSLERRKGLRHSVRSKSSTENDVPGKSAFDNPRKGRKVDQKDSWLMLTKVEDGTRYIPQLGDEVAYVLQGQDEFPKLYRLEDKGVSKSLRSQLRAVEICQVIGIEYKSLCGFSGVSCKLTLELIDEECEAVGKTFRLSLPELTDFPDFLINRSRYDASLRRNWTKRDKCKVWWRTNALDEDGNEKTGTWFNGRVIAVGPKSPEFPDSPWDSCSVQYSLDRTGPYRHSPWELFDLDGLNTTPSSMDDTTRLQILSTIDTIEASSDSNQDEYGLRALSRLLHKADFLNKTLVPLSLDTIKDRLRNKYYRSVDAFRFDIQLLAKNVEDYLDDGELTFKVQNLANRLLQES